MRLACITIGQAPRVDMVPEMRGWLPDVEVVEYGALDKLTDDQIAAIAPDPADEFLTTRLQDGSSVIIGRAGVLPLMQERIQQAERDGVDAILLVCTGEFPDFDTQVPLFTADHLLTKAVAGVVGKQAVGVLSPLEEQRESSKEKFAEVRVVTTAAASPYSAQNREEIARAAKQLADDGADWIVLDCMGYTADHRAIAAVAAQRPVVVARQAVAQLAGLAVSSSTARTSTGHEGR